MKRKALVTMVVLFVAVVLAACAGVTINPEDMAGIKNVGILSLTVAKVAPQSEANDAVMQEVANYAAGQVALKLKAVSSFKTYPVSSYYKIPEYQNAGTISKATGALEYLKNNPDAMSQDVAPAKSSKNFMKALKAGMKAAANAAAASADPIGAAQKALDAKKSEVIGAVGMPFVPYSVINNVLPGAGVTYVNGVKQGGGNEGLKSAMLEEAKVVCAKTRMDAVILVHVDTAADAPKGVYVIMGDRVLGTLRLNMTMLMIDKNGRVIADLDWPSMDDLAPMRLAKPSHIVTKWAIPNKAVGTVAVDLKDAGGINLAEYKDMVNESSGRMVESLRKALAEIK